jgi:hypothetical protein
MKLVLATLAFLTLGILPAYAGDIDIHPLNKEGFVAVGDLGRDGVAEIVTGSGFGAAPKIKLFRQDGSLINSFFAYDESFTRGVHVAIGDVDGNGVNDIITAPAYGGGAHIRIFDGYGQLHNQFFAYDPSFLGGAFITTRDINNDGTAEIITGAGPGGGPHVRIFKADGTLVSEFFAFEQSDRAGVTVGTVMIDKKVHILVGRASSDPPTIKVFTVDGKEQTAFNAFPQTFRGGVTPLGIDTNNNGVEEIVVTPNGPEATGTVFHVNGTPQYTLPLQGVVHIAAASLNPEAPITIVTIATKALREGPIEFEKSILIDLSEQRLSAYEYGLLVKHYPISSGVDRWPTPEGEFMVQKKIPIKDYRWNYGPGNPTNYYLPDVKYNLQFKPLYYLHYAYWHNNFGNQMSHGCVNMPLLESEWIYGWADVGTKIIIRE